MRFLNHSRLFWGADECKPRRGGMKESGVGRENGIEAFGVCTEHGRIDLGDPKGDASAVDSVLAKSFRNDPRVAGDCCCE